MDVKQLLLAATLCMAFSSGCGTAGTASTANKTQPVASTTTHSTTSKVKAGYKTYFNQGFGFSIQYPESWTEGPEPANNDGRYFHTPSNVKSFSNGIQGDQVSDSDVVLTVVGVPNVAMGIGVGQNFQQMLDEYKNKLFLQEKKSPDTVSVSYTVIPNKWICEVSVQKTGKNALQYQKQYISLYKIETLQLVYPAAEAQKYKTLIQEVSQSFNPGSPHN